MPTDWILPLVALTAMEIVLGIDNVIFLTIVVGRLPAGRQPLARRLGLGAALVTRLLLLLVLSYLASLDKAEVFRLSWLGVPAAWLGEKGDAVTWKDLVLLGGGLFLIGKSVHEIHAKLEGEKEGAAKPASGGFVLVLVQIALLDVVFSLDSVITAVGMASQVWVMVTAMVLAVGVMLFFAGAIGAFVHRHPTLKMLALSFLILIGVMLVADAAGQHIDRGYIYFAMGFALAVELLNLRARRKAAPAPAPPAPAPAAPAR